jgi:hypothetical protein
VQEQARFAVRWRALARPVRIGIVLLIAPLFYVIPWALRSAGLADLAALLLGVVLVIAAFFLAALVAFRTAPTDRPTDTV